MSDNLKVVIIDDEVRARENLTLLLVSYCPSAFILGKGSSVQEGIQLIEKLNPDIVFLDVQMQDGTGFDILDQILHIRFKVIFTTSFDDYAVKAFRYNAVDYLLKPINPDELVAAFNKSTSQSNLQINEQISNLIKSNSDKNFDQIILPTSNGMVFSSLHDIIRLESYGNYSFVFLQNGERILTMNNLKFYEEILPTDFFCRIHQSHIVNIHSIKRYIRQDGDIVEMADHTKIPIARRRKDDFIQLMKTKNVT